MEHQNAAHTSQHLDIQSLIAAAVKSTRQTDETPLSSAEAAKLLGIRPQTLNLMRSRGLGPDYYTAGRRRLYRRRDVLAWQEQQLVRQPR